jgi:hypothetical protein
VAQQPHHVQSGLKYSCGSGGVGSATAPTNYNYEIVFAIAGTKDDTSFMQGCGAGAAKSRIIWSEPEPCGDVAPDPVLKAPALKDPAPTMLIVQNHMNNICLTLVRFKNFALPYNRVGARAGAASKFLLGAGAGAT